VAGAENAVTTREAAVEVLALNVFNTAAGAPVTRAMVQNRLDELESHPPGCGCGLCELVPRVTVSNVQWLVARWQRSIAQTRTLARGGWARQRRMTR